MNVPAVLARCILCGLLGGLFGAGAVESTNLTIAGHWFGSLKASPLAELRLALELTNNASGKPGGVMVSLDQGNARILISGLSVRESAVRLEIASVGGTFEGKLADDGSELSGEWRQGGQALPLTFKRTEKAPQLNRPQEPSKPLPYKEEEVVIENAKSGAKLAGTLTFPKEPGPHPGVVLITGSGPQDRDEAIMGHRPFLVLADYLTRNGVVVLRCDDRGVGKSTGNYAAATEADFVDDALAEFAYLQARPEVGSARAGLVGHSEGAVIASIAATKSPSVAFIVMMAGVGVAAEELLVRQARDISLQMGLAEESVATNSVYQRQVFEIVKTEKDPQAAGTKLRALLVKAAELLPDEQQKSAKSAIDAQVRAVLSPWFRSLLSYDPASTLKAVKCPVLAINGEKDLQVAAKENLEGIRRALEAGGNTSVTVAELPGLNHLFQACKTGAVAEYGTIEETMNTAALRIVSDWIRRTAGAR